jgi:hypothetical protein
VQNEANPFCAFQAFNMHAVQLAETPDLADVRRSFMTQVKRGLSWRDTASMTSDTSDESSLCSPASTDGRSHLADEKYFDVDDTVADLHVQNQAAFSAATSWEAELPRLPGHIQHAADQVSTQLKEEVMRQVRLDPSALEGWTILLPELGVATVTDRGLVKKNSVTYLVNLVFEGRVQKVVLDHKKPQIGKMKKARNAAKTWKRYPFKLLFPKTTLC